MTVAPGVRIGAYEITALLGEGGMGQVWRAHHAALKRDDAIKVLPAAFAADRERLARFEREAQLLASLNHPHIAHVYGLETVGDSKALVMELVEGPTLADRIGQGPIPLDEALALAEQIAEALDAAHEQGIVHRDLKPANVKIRPDGSGVGTVKVLDFGLAKALDAAGASLGLSQAPTITTPAMTQLGVVLGTAAYMSPEQARGRAVDERTDIWAFGCVLYEMLTGRRAFQGEDVTETLASVVKDQPDLTRVPPRVRRLLAQCFEKDPKKRLRAIGDRHLLLREDEPKVSMAPRGHGWVGWAAGFALSLVALGAVSWIHFSETPTAAPSSVHLSIPLTEDAPTGYASLSPDGRLLVTGGGSDAPLQLRSLDANSIRRLVGTEGARTPFWSPDSRTVAFFADRKLKVVAASGGAAQTLCEDVGTGGGGSWSPTGTILFVVDGALRRVPAGGGPCTEVTKVEPGVARGLPVFLPDGEHFLFAMNTPADSTRGLWVGSLDDPTGRRLMADWTSGMFVPDAPRATTGRLLFVREQTLMLQPFDTATLTLSGEPASVAENVSFTSTRPQIAASASQNGIMVYLANSRPDRQLVWYDRSGREVGRAAKGGQAGYVSLSFDGKRAAFERANNQDPAEVWVQDVERGQEARLTARQLAANAPVWSPDGERVAFRATGSGKDAIYVKGVNDASERILLTGPPTRHPSDWSRDGRWLVYTEVSAKTGADIWLLPDPSSTSVDRKPIPWLVTPFRETHGQISPDGKWMAYTSDESGALAVYLRPFGGGSPASGSKWQVSSASGFDPRWRADGKELYYVALPATRRFTVMSVPIVTGARPTGTPTPLFEFSGSGSVPDLNRILYAPSPDGQRFLVNAYATDVEPSLEVLLNWGARPAR